MRHWPSPPAANKAQSVQGCDGAAQAIHSEWSEGPSLLEARSWGKVCRHAGCSTRGVPPALPGEAGTLLCIPRCTGLAPGLGNPGRASPVPAFPDSFAIGEVPGHQVNDQ